MDLSEYEIGVSGCVAAFRSLKAAKNLFMLLILLAILVQLASFMLVDFVGVLDPIYKPEPTTQQATNPQGAGDATLYKEVLQWALPAMKFLALVAGLLAVLTLMFAVKLSIVGRLGGIPGFMSALFWSMILLAMVTPWQKILQGSFASGALCNLSEMTQMTSQIKASWGAKDVIVIDRVLYYARFIAYPGLALVVWLVVMAKFAAGYKDSVLSPVGKIPQRPVQPGA
jgi:hypothetical protein